MSQPTPFTVTSAHIDAKLATMIGLQLAVPILNPASCPMPPMHTGAA